MPTAILVDNAKVMSKGQVTIPKEVRNILNVSTGDHITFICEKGRVVIMNSAIYAMKLFQEGMKDVSDTISEDEINTIVSDMRHGYVE